MLLRGLARLFSVWCRPPSRGLCEFLAVVGTVGFGTAIGVHPAIGYIDIVHLAPAVAAAVVYFTGIVLPYRPMVAESSEENTQ